MIKSSFISTESLTHYNPDLPIGIPCDTSCVGAVIFHTLPDGKERVVAYASCKLSQVDAQIQKEA